MTNMMTFYSVLSISRWSVVTLHPLLKASPQKFYGRHTESVDRYDVSTGADLGFQVRGGGGGGCALKKIAPSGAKIFGLFRVKNHDFTPKNHIFQF